MSLFSHTRSRVGTGRRRGRGRDLAPQSDGLAGLGRHRPVFTETNATSGNTVLTFAAPTMAHLTQTASFPTGGLGSGSSLGSQEPVAVDGDTVSAADAGSGDIAVLRVTEGGLRPIDRKPAGYIG
jgi:hypothetical protein